MKLGRSEISYALLVSILGLVLLGLGSLGANALANPHTTINQKNTPDTFAAGHELEGTSGILSSIRIPHGCNGQPVTAMAVVFPNGGDSVAINKESQVEVDLSEHIAGRVINVHPVQDRDIFRTSGVRTGQVNDVGGGLVEGIRAMVYTNGRLEPEHVGNLPFDASFPRFQETSCAASMQVNIGIANYCTHSKKAEDRADIWIGHLTPLFDDPAVVVQSPPGFWPQVTVIRDTENNPLPGSCPAPIHLAVSPASHEIDTYLPVQGYWPSQ